MKKVLTIACLLLMAAGTVFGAGNLVPLNSTKTLGTAAKKWLATYTLGATVSAGEGTNAVLLIEADEGDDTEDSWTFTATTGGEMVIGTESNTVLLTIGSTGQIQVTNSIIPEADDANDLGSTTKEFSDAFVDGIAHIDTVDVDNFLVLTPAVHASLASNGTITATTSYMKIAAPQISTCTVANATYAGQLLVIENIAGTNITIADSTTAMALGADAVLGATDTLTLIANAAAQWRKVSAGLDQP